MYKVQLSRFARVLRCATPIMGVSCSGQGKWPENVSIDEATNETPEFQEFNQNKLRWYQFYQQYLSKKTLKSPPAASCNASTVDNSDNAEERV